MQEFSSVTTPSSDPAALTAKLDEKSAEGWAVVAIVPTGSDVTAFLSRESSGVGTPAPAAEAEPAPVEPAPVVVAAPVVAAAAPAAEPAGWAVAPEPAPAVQPAATAAAGANPPADWYADPAHRFDLRYWDGSKWTEHVSRGGQQFTDPPVA